MAGANWLDIDAFKRIDWAWDRDVSITTRPVWRSAFCLFHRLECVENFQGLFLGLCVLRDTSITRAKDAGPMAFAICSRGFINGWIRWYMGFD